MTGTAVEPTAPPHGSVLLTVLARAASPAERRAGGWLRPIGDPAVAEERLQRWTYRVADGCPDRVAEILTEHRLTAEQWREGLGEVEEVPGEAVPPWVEDAVQLMDLVGTTEDHGPVPRLREIAGHGLPGWVDGEQPWRFHGGFADWLGAARRLVLGWTAETPVTPSARRDLELDLARRQLSVCGPLLMAEAARRDADDPLFGADPREDWECLWAGHPVVARLLATTWRQWRSATAELCARIADDLPELRSGVDVARIELSAGDQHGDGRGVARLRLTDESSLFLKPRRDGLHRVLAAVLHRVDGRGPSLGLRLPEIVERERYCWVREVAAEDCRDDRAVDAYFRRAGSLLRVLQAMGATDLHQDNFIPTENQPVLVDLETVVAPGPLRTAPPDDPAIVDRLADTPGGTSMVTSVVAGPPGRRTADIGALAGPSATRTPYAVPTLVPGPQGPELRSDRPLLAAGAALPTLAGRPVGLRGHEQALVDGFCDVQDRLERLADLDPVPDDAAGSSARFVARPTRTYARLLRQSISPDALRDGVERELVLERLYRATGTAPAGLIGCEVDALRDLDIPLFTVPFDGTELLSDRGVVLADAVTESPRSRTVRRLRSVRAHTDHVDDLLATLHAMDPDTPELPASRRTDRPSGRPTDPLASEPARILLDRAIVLGDDTCTWVGLDHDPNRHRWSHGLLSAGLTGQAGIGLALATIATRPDGRVPGCAEVARAALLGSVARVSTGATGPGDGLTGPAGVLYATARAARLLRDETLWEAARELVSPCLRAARRAEPSYVIDGSAGAALALLQLPEGDLQENGRVADALTELAAGLASTPAANDLDPPDLWSRSLPSRAAGRISARRALQHLRPEQIGAIRPGGPVLTTPGDAVAAACHDAVMPDLAPLGPEPDLPTLLERAALVDAARSAATRHPAPGPAAAGWAALRAEVTASALHRRVRAGRWCGPSVAPDHALVDAVHGLAALALVCTAPGTDDPVIRVLG